MALEPNLSHESIVEEDFTIFLYNENVSPVNQPSSDFAITENKKTAYGLQQWNDLTKEIKI